MKWPTAASLEPDQVADQPQERPRRRLAARAVTEPAHLGVGHPQLDRFRAPLTRHHGALVLGGRARHGKHAAPGVEHDHARLERTARRARNRGQAGTRLDRVRDRVEGLEEGALLCGHHA